MSIIVTNVEQQKQIINQVCDVLYNIQSEFERNFIPTLQVSVDNFNDITLQYNNFKIYNKIQNRVEVTYGNNETLILPLCDSIKHLYIVIQNSLRGIKERLDNYKINNVIQSMQQDIDNMLVESFNNYMKSLNISYSVTNINQIDWKNLCERTEMSVELLKQFANIVDWKIISQFGKFDINDLFDWNLDNNIDERLLILYNTNFSVKFKQAIIEEWDEARSKEGNVDWLTNILINDRLEQGVAVDNILKYLLENDIELNYELLSANYPLTADIVTQYFPKFSIDKLRTNKNVNCDIFVLVTQKLTQTQNK